MQLELSEDYLALPLAEWEIAATSGLGANIKYLHIPLHLGGEKQVKARAARHGNVTTIKNDSPLISFTLLPVFPTYRNRSAAL